MTHSLTAAAARSQSQNNRVIEEEIAIISLAVIDAIANNSFTATVNDSSTVTLHGTTVTSSTMTSGDTDSQDYYKAWQGTITDNVKTQQMNQVIRHFDGLGYSISRKSTTGTYFYWEVRF